MLLIAFAALATALCVAASNLIATPAARHFGPFAFNRWRLAAALLAVAVVATWRDGWQTLSYANLGLLVLSGIVGIVIGDSAVYAAMARLGPRRAGMLYATSAPMAGLLGAIFLDEWLTSVAWVGIGLVVIGIWIALAYREDFAAGHWEEIRGHRAVGILLGLLGGFGQAAATLVARPVMAAGADPAAAASLRIVAALLGLALLSARSDFRSRNEPTAKMLGLAALSGCLGMGAGMTLLLFALSGGPTGVVVTFAATTPIMLLPLLWLVSGRRPAPQAWFGAALTVAGIALLALDVDG